MKKILFILFIITVVVGCDDRLDELNTDKRNPAEVDPESLFSMALREAVDMTVSINVNDNPFRLFAQHWAQTTYPDESQYNLTGRTIPQNFWTNGYRDALIDFKQSKILLEQQLESGDSGIPIGVLNNRLAVVDIMMAYVFTLMVDTFGDIPYTEALDPENLTPKYDDARTIYNDLISRLDAAAAAIDPDVRGFTTVQDPLYESDMSKWYKFANTWRMRMGMMLADVDKNASVQIVNDALADGVFTSNDDNASLTYYEAAPNTNPVFEDLVLSGRQDFVAANTIVNIMNALDDPRRRVYFRENLGPDVFEGGIYGDANNYSGFTQVGDLFHTPTLPGFILTYAHVEFWKAEAVERGGYSVTGSAEQHYNEAIRASFDQWDVDQFDEYISQPAVAYSTASGDFKQKIGIQMWLALYNQGFDAWTEWRRLDFEGFNPPPDLTIGDIPLRFTYPLVEAQLNGEEYRAAADAIGGNEKSTPIFWDVFPPSN
jgi:hypothetical protein